MAEKEELIDRLVELALGRLESRNRHKLDKLIQGDADLAALYSLVESLVLMRADARSSTVSDAIRKLSKELYRDFLRDRSDPDSRHGITVFDSGSIPLADGVRPAAVDTRRLRYRLGDWHLELSSYPITPASYELIGQLLGMSPGRRLRVKLRGSKTSLTCQADQFYLFRFAKVPAAKYTLTIRESGHLLGTVDLRL